MGNFTNGWIMDWNMNMNMNMNMVDDILISSGVPYKKDFCLSTNTYSKTGGFVKRYIMPSSISQFIYIVKKLEHERVEYKIIGETTNVIFHDAATYGIFISTKLLTDVELSNPEVVIVEAGKSLPDFVRDMSIRGFKGFEGLEGIPGSLGGAICMNAGAYGYEISDNLISVRVLNELRQEVILDKDELLFRKRSSLFRAKPRLIILSASFKKVDGDISDIHSKIEKYHIARHLYQEWAYPNLGSIFTTENGIYDEFSSQNVLYKLKYKFARGLFFNKIARFINRKNPSNKKINNLIIREFGFLECDGCFSHKNMNTFCNKAYSTKKIMGYIYKLFNSVNKKRVSLEIELAVDSIYSIEEEFQYNEVNEMYFNMTRRGTNQLHLSLGK